MVGIVLASVAAGVLPMVLALFLVWWLDRYDREPLSLLCLAFFWGAFGASAIGFFGGRLVHGLVATLVAPETNAWLTTAVIAPAVEESGKAIIVAVIYFHRKFDNLTDGIVYGAASGLGFAMVENPLYFIETFQTGGASGWVANIVLRTSFTGLMHMVATACYGAFLGAVKFRDIAAVIKIGCAAGGLASAFTIHALWNGLIVATQLFETSIPFLVAIPLFIVELLLLAGAFQASLVYEGRLIRRELAAEAEAGTIPTEHATILGRFVRRSSPRFAAELGPRRAEYIALATQLAFRRHQLARCSAADRAWISVETDRLREQVRAILASARPDEPKPSG